MPSLLLRRHLNMTNQIRIVDKHGKVKFIAQDNGKILEVGKGGKLNEIHHKDSKKEEVVEITPDDMKE